MPMFFLVAPPLIAAKTTLASAAAFAGPIIATAVTGFVVDFAKARGKKMGSMKTPKKVYEEEYTKTIARKEAERNARDYDSYEEKFNKKGW